MKVESTSDTSTLYPGGYTPLPATKAVAGRKYLTLASSKYDSSWELQETTDGYGLKVPVPGLDRQDILVQVENGMLTIAVHHETPGNQAEHTGISPIKYDFSKEINLPEQADGAFVFASYWGGFLDVYIPKNDRSFVTQLLQIPVY